MRKLTEVISNGNHLVTLRYAMFFKAFTFLLVRSFVRKCKCKFTLIHSVRLHSSELSSTNIGKHLEVPRTIVFFSHLGFRRVGRRGRWSYLLNM